ncbi:MAG TPA: NUDIX domain-containing protein [Candidatus Absconditabacterales bacterium]|nr:NUDIX domain-containing protein [Candidatus Absconditabacterales bacterium]
MVKHKYHNDLFLPGGGLHNGEEFVSALKRELKEELNLDIIELELFGVYQNMKEYKMDTIVLFISFQEIDLKNISLIDEEIELFMMADINNLPENISPGTKRRIEEFKLKKNPIVGKW